VLRLPLWVKKNFRPGTFSDTHTHTFNALSKGGSMDRRTFLKTIFAGGGAALSRIQHVCAELFPNTSKQKWAILFGSRTEARGMHRCGSRKAWDGSPTSSTPGKTLTFPLSTASLSAPGSTWEKSTSPSKTASRRTPLPSQKDKSTLCCLRGGRKPEGARVRRCPGQIVPDETRSHESFPRTLTLKLLMPKTTRCRRMSPSGERRPRRLRPPPSAKTV